MLGKRTLCCEGAAIADPLLEVLIVWHSTLDFGIFVMKGDYTDIIENAKDSGVKGNSHVTGSLIITRAHKDPRDFTSDVKVNSGDSDVSGISEKSDIRGALGTLI